MRLGFSKKDVRNVFPRSVSGYRRLRFRMLHKPKITYAFSGEDTLISYIVSNKKKSVRFVDVGCAHPIFDNNTFLLYRKGHFGVNVDARGEVKKLYSLFRPRDRFVNSIVSDSIENEFANFYVNADDPHVSSISASWAVGNLEAHDNLKVKRLPVVTLADIFSSNWIFLGLETVEKRKSVILVLSVDVEGQDFSVLKSNDWTLYLPDVICIETFGSGSIIDIIQSEIFEFLSLRSYKLTAMTPLTSIFTLKTLDESLEGK